MNSKRRRRLARLFALPALACAAAGALVPTVASPRKPPEPVTIEGEVTAVTRGDTLWITPAGGAAVEIRLRDIDAPEPCQAWGEESRQALAEQALHKTASARISGRDGGHRLLASVRVEGRDLGPWLVEEGDAWSIRTRWDRGPLVKQETVARAFGRGLHAAGGAVMPRDFRRTHGPCPPATPASAASR